MPINRAAMAVVSLDGMKRARRSRARYRDDDVGRARLRSVANDLRFLERGPRPASRRTLELLRPQGTARFDHRHLSTDQKQTMT